MDAVKARDSCDNTPEGNKKAEEFQKDVIKYYELLDTDGYFRDSYNSTSIFWQCGLSWWDNPYINKHGNISVKAAKRLLERMRKKHFDNVTDLDLDKLKDIPDEELPEWVDYFEKKRKDFIKFLRTAIKKREHIYCSV